MEAGRIGLDVRKYGDFGIGTYIRHLVDGISGMGVDLPENSLEFTLFHSDEFNLPPGPFSLTRLKRYRRLPFQGSLPPVEGMKLYHAPHYITPDSGDVPLILTVHDTIHMEPPVLPDTVPALGSVRNKAYDRFKKKYHRWLSCSRLKGLMENARHIIAVSDWTCSRINAWVPGIESRTTRIYNCLDDLYFQEISENQVTAFCRERDLPHGAYMVYCGNDLYHKNLGCLLAAWKKLPTTFSPPLMVLAGIPRENMIRHLLDKMDLNASFRLIGRLQPHELPLLYSGAMGFITPTLAEGFGLPVAESMACGTPVICSNIPVLREITGDNAFFFNPALPDELADRLVEFCNNPTRIKQLAQSGKQFAGKYELSGFTRAHLRVYNQLLRE